MKERNFEALEKHLLEMQDHEVEIIFIQGKPFIIQPATPDDIERINIGYFCMD
ncbi:hypothetical protein LJK88_38370 [Paenibacillus sp. P26]|nr:hypothetical protein LJK88_38370 [Paenibacillus sp. P26]UUZ93204.1 hypothetical protein LJK87_49925 [Paenibacillus sp. P25]